MSRYFNDYGFDESEVDNDNELYHFGIMGQKWGLRRFQNKDGTLTPEGKMRYLKTDSSITKRVKKDWNSMSDKEFKGKYAASKKTYLKRVKKYGDPYMNSPLAKTGKKLYAMQKGRKYRDSDAIDELKEIKKSNGKMVKFDKNTAVKALAGLAVTAAGAAAIHKLMSEDNSPRVTSDSLQKNFSSAFDKPSRKPDRVTSDSLKKNFSSAFEQPSRKPNRVTPDNSSRKPDRVTSDSLQKNFSSAFDIPDLASSRLKYMRNEANKKAEANGVRPVQSMRDEDSLARNFSDAFDLRKPDNVENKKESDAKRKFEDSAKAAREAGVPENKILKTKEDIDKYFEPMPFEEFDKGMSDPDNTLVFDKNGMHFEKRKK